MSSNLCNHVFLSQEVRTNYLERLEALFADPMTEVFPFSYQYAFQSFVHFNKHFQREEPLLSRLQDQIQQFLKRVALNFSKLFLLQVEICLVMHGENIKIKNQVALIFDNIFFIHFWTSNFFLKVASLSNTII